MSLYEMIILVCLAIGFVFVWTMLIRASARGGG